METELTASLLAASSAWKSFSLDSRRAIFDKTSAVAKSNSSLAQTARKALAESTKAFKKCLKSTESSITLNGDQQTQFQKLSSSCKGIVKSYQEEIDILTKRCKASDGAVVELSKGMTDIPDPAPLLSSAVEHLESMSGQVTHLLKGMEEMQRELEVKQKEHLQSTKTSDEELSQLRKLLDESNAKNKKLEKELKSANTTSVSSQNEISYMSKEEKEELIELRREVVEYEVEFKTLKNQDITIKKLDAKIEDLLATQEEELQRELK